MGQDHSEGQVLAIQEILVLHGMIYEFLRGCNDDVVMRDTCGAI